MRKAALLIVTCITLLWAMPMLHAAPGEAASAFPTIVINEPQNGAVLADGKSRISVSFHTPEKRLISKVQVFLDGKFITERAFDAPVAEGSAAFMWDTARTADGQHRLDIQTFSGKAYVAMATCMVTVANSKSTAPKIDLQPPQVKITSPTEGQVISGKTRIIVNATDDSGQAPYVSIAVDNALKSMRNFAPYSYDWDTSQQGNGPHSIEVTAMDESENREVTKIQVIVKNPVKLIPVAAEEPVKPVMQPTAKEQPKPAATVLPAKETAVRVSSSIQEYNRTVSSLAQVNTEGFEVRETSSPEPRLPALPTEEPAERVVTAPEQLNAPASPSSVSPAQGTLEDGKADPAPQTSVSAPTAVPAPRLSPSELPAPLMKTERRLSVPPVASRSAARTEAAATQPVVAYKDYVVKVGDRVELLAKRFGVTVSALVAANKLEDPGLIKIGDKLHIPVVKGVLMMPIRPAFEEVGGSVRFDKEARSIYASSSEHEVTLKLGSTRALVNDREVALEAPPSVESGRAMVPSSFINKTLAIGQCRIVRGSRLQASR